MTRREHEPYQRRENHERHHPRLHQFEIIAGAGNAWRNAGIDAGITDFRFCKRYAHRISGSVSY